MKGKTAWPGPVRDFHLDANRINGRGRLVYVNELEMWRDLGIIMLGLSEVIHGEVILNDKDGRRGAKARMETRTETLISNPEEKRLFHRIELVLFGEKGPRNQNESNDVEALFNAKKYHRTFVTDDGSGGRERGILTHREELADLGIPIVTDHEAVLDVRKVLRVKAHNMSEICSFLGKPQPEWIEPFESYDAQYPL